MFSPGEIMDRQCEWPFTIQPRMDEFSGKAFPHSAVPRQKQIRPEGLLSRSLSERNESVKGHVKIAPPTSN